MLIAAGDLDLGHRCELHVSFCPMTKQSQVPTAGMEDMAKSIKNIKSAEVIFRAINDTDDPVAFIDAEVQFAKAHNAANSAAILRWADEQEAKGIEIPEKVAKIVKALVPYLRRRDLMDLETKAQELIDFATQNGIFIHNRTTPFRMGKDTRREWRPMPLQARPGLPL